MRNKSTKQKRSDTNAVMVEARRPVNEEEEAGLPLDGPVTVTVIQTIPQSAPTATSLDGDDGEPTISPQLPHQTTETGLNPVTSVSPTTTDTTITSSTTATLPSSTLSSLTTSALASLSTPIPSSAANAQDNNGAPTVTVSSGAIAGIVVGCLVVLLVATVFGLRKRNVKKNRLKLRGLWVGSKKAFQLGRNGSDTGTGGSNDEFGEGMAEINPYLTPTPYIYQPDEGRRWDLEARMSFADGPTTCPATPQALPAAHGYNGNRLSPAGSVYSSSRSLALAGTGVGAGGTEVVVRTFIPSLPDELSTSMGETLEILEVFDDGWVECMSRDGNVGMVPMECFRVDRPESVVISSPDEVPTTRNSRRYSSLPNARR